MSLPPEQSARIDGITITYREAGSGFPLVLIPGRAAEMRTAEIAHSGHVIYMEAAIELNGLLGDFLDAQGNMQ